MRDFQCCGVTLPTLHDLLQHYEEAHATRSSAAQPRTSSQASTIAAALAQQQLGLNSNNQAAARVGGLQAGATDRTLEFHRKPSQLAQQHPDLDAIDDMELDDEDAMATPPSAAQIFSSQAGGSGDDHHRSGGAGPASTAAAGGGGANQTVPSMAMLSHQGFNGGGGAGGGTKASETTPTNLISLQNNPTVSSVNTPVLMHNPLHPQNAAAAAAQQQFHHHHRPTPDSSAPGTPSELDEDIVDGLGDLSMHPTTTNSQQQQYPKFAVNNNDMVDLCIDEPAKRLFSPNGGFIAPGNTSAQFKLNSGGAQYGPNSEIARRIREQQLLAGVPDTSILLPNEEPKPFRCPVIGCEKAYKNQNGLKYHKAVSNQRLAC